MEAFNRIQHKFHHLAQFLAAFGNSYLPKAEDDSQSNMEWSVKENALISRSVNNIYLSLDFKNITLKVVKDDIVKALELPGLDHSAIDAWIRAAISDFGLDASAYHYDLGFRLDTPFDNFAVPDAEDKKT
ncbi:MAG: hypothetical protein KDD04_00595, partial [Sinomicrobium sp.]|nr:hypothetical protein [Sinomicrobium sp.]